MSQSIARILNYPIWAHSEYESSYDGIQQLTDSLSVGDVIQIGNRKTPLRIDRRDEEGTLYSEAIDPLDDTVYRIEQGNGRTYGTYFHRESSKKGIGELAVIYRADGSISSHTVPELREILGSEQQTKPFEVTWKTAETTVRPIPTSNRGTPRVPKHDPVDDEIDAEKVIADAQRHARKPEVKAIRRYQNGESVEDIDGLTRETDFETKTTVTETIMLPQSRSMFPHGILFFRVRNADLSTRNAIPLDALESIKEVELADRGVAPSK